MPVHDEQLSRRLLVFFLGRHLEETDKDGGGMDRGFSSRLQCGSRLLVMARIGKNHLASTAFNTSGEEGHQRKAKAMAALGSEGDGALVRESDEEKKWRHWKDPHVGAVEKSRGIGALIARV
jgi:hypothetical protein